MIRNRTPGAGHGRCFASVAKSERSFRGRNKSIRRPSLPPSRTSSGANARVRKDHEVLMSNRRRTHRCSPHLSSLSHIRGALTNGKTWWFILLALDPVKGNIYWVSDDFHVFRRGRGASEPSVQMVAGILAHWVRDSQRLPRGL